MLAFSSCCAGFSHKKLPVIAESKVHLKNDLVHRYLRAGADHREVFVPDASRGVYASPGFGLWIGA